MKDAVVIIGAGSGLSASIARRFFGGDEAIILAARTTENLSTLATSTGATCIQCDASKPEDVSALFAHIDDMGLSPSVLVYNAGAYVRGAVTDLLPEDVQRVISVNAFGAFLAARECAKRMKATRLGTMLFTGASAGIKGHANSSAFAMGKFALRGLCQSLARELAPQNIHVAHFVIDGLIHAPERGAPYDNREVCLDPDAVAETYFQISKQDKSAWTWEIELRPFVETF